MIELDCLPYGAGHADEGVCLLLQMGPHRILLDCGLTRLEALLSDLSTTPIDLVLCTHAHPDHAKGLLALHQAYPKLPIYASEVTTQLLPLNWLDQAPPLFCQALPWRSPVEFREGLSAELFPAGHLPGAAALLLTYSSSQRSYTVLYTGDYLLSNSRLVDGLPLDELRGLKPDVLITEGSYGTARFPHRRQQENQLVDRIHRAIGDRQSVLLPTPTLGLGQELLMLLRSHHHFTGRDVTIWVDGSVALGCDAYLAMLPHFPSTVQNFARHQPLFWDDRVRPRVRRLAELVGEVSLPTIVLTDLDADFSRFCRPETGDWLLLLPQSPGRASQMEATIAELSTSPPLRVQQQRGALTIESYLLTDHCDQSGTMQLIHNLRPQHVVFVHGTPAYLSDLTSLEELQNRYHLHSPAIGTRVELPIGETFIQPAPPEARYEGEVADLETAVVISLPEAIVDDARWQLLADTGLVEARWQGEELVLRGLSQREIMSQVPEAAAPANTECCENCTHFRGQRCWNQASPLFGFKVTPEGYCPVFEAALPPRSPSTDAATEPE